MWNCHGSDFFYEIVCVFDVAGVACRERVNVVVYVNGNIVCAAGTV